MLADAAGDGRANHVMLGLAHLLLKEDASGEESTFAPLVAFLMGASRYPFLEDCVSLPGASGAFAQLRADRNSQFIDKLCSVHPSLKPHRVGLAVGHIWKAIDKNFLRQHAVAIAYTQDDLVTVAVSLYLPPAMKREDMQSLLDEVSAFIEGTKPQCVIVAGDTNTELIDAEKEQVEAVNTRAVYCEKAQVCAFPPLLDLANHDARPSAAWSMDEGRRVVLTARRDLAAGDEVTISYGDDPNSELFVAYGFLPQGDGPHRSVDLRVWLHPPDLQRYGTQASAELRILASGAVKNRAAAAPLLKGARAFLESNPALSVTELGPQPHERLVADALIRCAKAEECAWLKVLADRREKLAPLVEANCACLLELIARVEAWLNGPRSQSLMTALSAAPAPSDPDSGEESGSDSSASGSEAGAQD